MPELNLTIVIVSKFCIIFQDTHNSMLQKYFLIFNIARI